MIGDLQEIRDYIATFNPRAAQNTADRLIAAGNSLISFPHRGRPVPETELRELVAVHPYIIRHRVAGERVVILRVRHGRAAVLVRDAFGSNHHLVAPAEAGV